MDEQERQELLELHQNIEVGQITRHYKGGLYRILDKVSLEADDAPALVYAPLDRTQPVKKWTRATAAFFEEVNDSPRFSFSPLQSMEGIRAAIPPYIMSTEAVDSVLQRYDSPDRYYHDRQHILGMFNRATADGVVLSAEQAIAILFHDAVYSPGAPKGFNEESSCKLMKLYAPRIRPSVQLEFAKAIIMDTVEHTPTYPESPAVLDLDLIGLAGSLDEFKTIWELNRLECAHLLADEEAPRAAFDAARLKVLIKMCKKPRLFKSRQYATEDNEQRFRDNVEAIRLIWSESRQS